jgi:Cu(I)/Ag(I) efflux system periplasmic protein CusF
MQNSVIKRVLGSLIISATAFSVSSFAQTGMAQGQITRIDTSTGKVTIRHGEIKSIDMPPMTMVFTAKPKSTLDGLKVGDKIDFVAMQENDALFVTKVVKTSP